MPSTEIVQVRNCIHVANIFSFRVNVQSVGLKILGLKLVKLDCITI